MNDEVYFKELRRLAYQKTEQTFSKSGASLKLGEIDARAVSAAYKHGYTWAWDDDDNAHLASRFEVAVWEARNLTGLCRGKPIEVNSKLCLEIVEAAPDVPLSQRYPILPIISVCATIYAKQIGATEIRLMEPTSPSRIKLYTRLGYKYVAAGDYLVREV